MPASQAVPDTGRLSVVAIIGPLTFQSPATREDGGTGRHVPMATLPLALFYLLQKPHRRT